MLVSAGKLSNRGWANVEDIMPRIAAAVRERERRHQVDTKGLSTLEEEKYGQQQSADLPAAIDLSTAEDWSIRSEVLQITVDSLSRNLAAQDFSYPGGFAGDPQLLATLAQFFNNHFYPHQPVTNEHVVVGTGAAGCLDNLLYNTCDPGDGVLIPAPYWSAFDFVLRVRNGVEIIPVQVDELDQVFTDALIEALERVLNSSKVRCKALVVSNPHNPLAQCYPPRLVEKMLLFCERHDLHYISDEIFALTCFPSSEATNLALFSSVLSIDLDALSVSHHRVHMVWSTSKDFGLNGIRLGTIVTQNNVELRTATALSGNTTVSSLTAAAVTSLLRHDDLPRLLSVRSERLARAYSAMVALFRKHRLPFIPAYAGLFVFVRIAPTAETWDEENRAVERLKEGGVNVAAGKDYHMPDSCKGWARVSFALLQDVLDDAIKKMDAIFLLVEAEF